MTKQEFEKQSAYCREFNTPEGPGCDNCPANNKNHCADRLMGLCGKLLKSRFTDKEVSQELDHFYGIPPLAQLSLIEGFIDLPSEEERMERKELEKHFLDVLPDIHHLLDCDKCDKIIDVILGNQGGAVRDKSIKATRLLEIANSIKSYEPLAPQVATDGPRREGRTNLEVFNILSDLMKEINVTVIREAEIAGKEEKDGKGED